jgi:manganese-dependent inorganic pyrophosphatase
MTMPIYVIGHKNPDTDSICASLALAALKRELGEDCVAARIGVLNPETDFILKKVGVEPPIYLKTAKSTLSEITIDEAVTIHQNDTLRDGWDQLMKYNTKTLYVLDDKDEYIGLVTLGDISSIQMQDLNITKELLKETPIENLAKAVHGEIMLLGDKARSGEVRISDKKMMERDLQGAIMILNDHEDIMIKSMGKGAAVIVVAEDYVPNDFIFEMAKNMGVSIIRTPYNIMKIIQMIYRSIPVKHIMTPKDFMISFNGNEYLEDVEREMLKTRHSSYPVVDKKKVVGSVARYHLLKSDKKRFILVDHNEKKQSIDDIEKGEIIEIVDHHRIGDIETDKPIIFRNMIVGSSCTIVAMMYQEYGIRMSEKIAKLIAYAMISDTMNFHSPTCTQIDKILKSKLEIEYDLNMDEMAKELFANTASIKDKEFKDILYNDTKPYDLNGFHIQVSQVFVFDFHDIDNIKEQFEYYMQEQIKNTNLDLWLMVFTNVEGEGSKILHVGRLSHQLDDAIAQFEAKGYVSRKKEIVPGIAKALA